MNSMTAFARVNQAIPGALIEWEIRSVNQRFLELNFKLPDNYRHLEMSLRDQCKQVLQRGKLDISLKVQQQNNADGLPINQALLSELTQAICDIQQRLPEATHVNPLDILNWPGLVQQPSVGTDELHKIIIQNFDSALSQLNESRQREGQQLAVLILQRTQSMRQIIDELKPLIPAILQQQQQRMRQRISELSSNLDETRLAMEIALLAQKLDIEEELDRLQTHLTEVTRVVNQSGAIGRRLDFLMQELNREANTLGSKSIDSRSTQASIELKVLIEQMREQVQNIE